MACKDLKVWAHYKNIPNIPGVDRGLRAGDCLKFAEDSYLKVLETPGHTDAHLCLLAYINGHPYALFSGDCLFNAGVGNCHNGGKAEVLYNTVYEELRGLPDEVILYPGHEYLGYNLRFTLDREPSNKAAKKLLEEYEKTDINDSIILTNMQAEREVNTFFRLEEKEIIDGLKGDTYSNKQVFLRLRELRNNW